MYIGICLGRKAESMGRIMKLSYGTASAAVLLYILYEENARLLMFFSDLRGARAYIASWGKLAPVVFVFFQVLQVVLFFLPGELVQISGGYLFGMFSGTVLSIVGIEIGAWITYVLSSWLGSRVWKHFFKKNENRVIKTMLIKTENKRILFLLYLLPGFPKDVLGYIMGATSMKLTTFLSISTLGRLPGLFLTCFIGQNLHGENYSQVMEAVFFSLIVVLIIYFERRKIINYMGSLVKSQHKP